MALAENLFENFNRIEVKTIYRGENLEFGITVNLSQTEFHIAITDWLKKTDERTARSFCEYINLTEGHIAYTDSDFVIAKKMVYAKTMN